MHPIAVDEGEQDRGPAEEEAGPATQVAQQLADAVALHVDEVAAQAPVVHLQAVTQAGEQEEVRPDATGNLWVTIGHRPTPGPPSSESPPPLAERIRKWRFDSW